MTSITREAKDRPCQIRLPGCDGGGIGGTTVPCHFPMIQETGMGMKAPDLLVAWGCHSCHDRVDGRRNLSAGAKLALAIGVLRTLTILWREGKLRYEP